MQSDTQTYRLTKKHAETERKKERFVWGKKNGILRQVKETPKSLSGKRVVIWRNIER